MKKHISFLFIAVFVFLLSGEVTTAKAARPGGSLTVSPYFTSNMVLQRDMPVPVFGTATAGSTVTVTFSGQSKMVVTPPTGKWIATMAPMAADNFGSDLVVSGGGKSFTFSDVLVGEV
jgi:sialate O-acetylesterase